MSSKTLPMLKVPLAVHPELGAPLGWLQSVWAAIVRAVGKPTWMNRDELPENTIILDVVPNPKEYLVVVDAEGVHFALPFGSPGVGIRK